MAMTESKQQSSQWKSPNSPRTPPPPPSKKKKKNLASSLKFHDNVCFFFFLDADGIEGAFDPPGQTVNQQFYLIDLNQLCNSL